MAKAVVTSAQRGRKKLPRQTTFDTSKLLCTQWWPVWITDEVRKSWPVVVLSICELQALIDRDMEWMTMAQACKDMGISKTVFAGIYTSARKKLTKAIITGATLQIECEN